MGFKIDYEKRIKVINLISKFTDLLALGFLIASTFQMAKVFGDTTGAYAKALAFDGVVLVFSRAIGLPSTRGWSAFWLWIALIVIIVINMAINVYYGYSLLAATKYKVEFTMEFIFATVDTVDHIKVWSTDAIMPPIILGLALAKRIFNSQVTHTEKLWGDSEKRAAATAKAQKDTPEPVVSDTLDKPQG